MGKLSCMRTGLVSKDINLFSSPVGKYRKICSTTIGFDIWVSKMLKFYIKVLCDGQGIVMPAMLYTDRSCEQNMRIIYVLRCKVSLLFHTNLF